MPPYVKVAEPRTSPSIGEVMESRFWAKVEKGSGPDDCWIWKGSRDKNGYGYVRVRRKLLRAHRLGYEIQVGALPDGMQALHRCDNPPCVRGDHLFAGTIAENARDRNAKGRWRLAEIGNA